MTRFLFDSGIASDYVNRRHGIFERSEVNHQTIRLLAEHIGIVDTFRFVNQFTTGHGNNTEERHALFDHPTLDDIVCAIEERRVGQWRTRRRTLLETSQRVDLARRYIR